MRLAPYASEELVNPAAGERTLDEILAANAVRNPHGVALHAPELGFEATWREVDRAASSLAATFASWSLGEDAAVGVQLGSTPHAALTCLALWRAGLVPAMLPLAFRRRETIAALASVGATAVVAPARGGGANLAEVACEVAAGLETIRFIGCFGDPTPDGATPLDAALDRPAARFVRADRPDDAADHVAVVTFDAGGAPVARSHNDLAAAGLGPILACRLSDRSTLVSTLDLAGLGGLATGFAPWLLAGCATAFHTAATTQALSRTIADSWATHIALPGRAAAALRGCGLGDGTLHVAAVWRAPDGRGAADDLPAASSIVDVVLFGELGLHAAIRATRERHAVVPLGPASPAESVGPLIELKVGDAGRLAIRGPACPQAPCPADPTAPALAFDAEGFVETGLTAVADRATRRIALGGRRRGVAQVGGLALSLADVEAAYRRCGVRGRPTLVDDPVFGARLTLSAGAEDDAARAAEALGEAGFGPALAPWTPAQEPLETASTLRSA